MRLTSVLVLAAILIWQAPSAGDVPYSGVPDWLSAEASAYGTGCALADVNGDGFLDLAVSNGNDMLQAPNYVYLNAAGVLPNVASWVSDDLRYSGHCEFADVDRDGYPELMVANYITPGWSPARVQIYNNIGGVLETTPSWETNNTLHCFRATFGDPDGDGDLDLAVATGESYTAVYEHNFIYFNNNGFLAKSPGWVSADLDASYDVQFVDIDSDGDQDLAMLTSGGPVKIYYNDNGVIDTLPGWQSAAADDGNTFDFADVNGDGYFDLGVATNNQLGGTGYFQIYLSNSGVLNASPDWLSATAGYGSAAVFVDVDFDSDCDFVTGRWWGRTYAYLNVAGSFPVDPDWTDSDLYESVVENITFGDIDNGAQTTNVEVFAGDGQRKLFYLDYRYIHGVDSVVADGVTLTLAQYCYHREDGWLSLAAAPAVDVAIAYRYSRRNDMVVSNWDTSTYIFTHDELSPVAAAGNVAPVLVAPRVFPNPFNAATTISYQLARPSRVRLEIFDLRGKKLQTVVDEPQGAGLRSVVWRADHLPSGLYVYRLHSGRAVSSGKIHLVK